MSTICTPCGKKIKNNQQAVCCDSDCGRWFHVPCIKMNKETYHTFRKDESFKWSCNREDCLPQINISESMASFSKKIEESVKTMQEENKELKKLANFLSEKYDELHQQLEVLRKERKVVLDTDIATKKVVADFEDQLQYQRKNNLIFHGIPMEREENVIQKVLNIGKVLDVNITPENIDAAHRLPSTKPGPQPVIVKFVNRWKKEDILAQRRVKKTLKTNQIGYSGPGENIYINEHLTPKNELIAKKCRELRQQGKIFATWVRDCKIYIRISQDSPSKLIKSAEMLHELAQVK